MLSSDCETHECNEEMSSSKPKPVNELSITERHRSDWNKSHEQVPSNMKVSL